MNTLARVCALVCALTFAMELPAQVATSASTGTNPAVADATKAMNDALKLRGDMAGTVASNSEKPAAAIARLKANGSPSGLKIDSDADFAFAAIDVGQRLIAAGKPTEAEQFFQEAEKSLASVLNKTPDSAARDKAQYLQKLALIRSLYLNNAAQAKADIDQAIALLPDDKYLPQFRASLANERAQVFNDKPVLPT